MGDPRFTTYTFYFFNGTVETGEGTDVGDAFSKLGHPHEEIPTVDMFEEGPINPNFIYNKDIKSWDIITTKG